MQADVAHLPPTVLVEKASDASPLVFVGIMASGPGEQAALLETAAAQKGVHTDRLDGEGGSVDLLILFDNGTTPAAAYDLYRTACSGVFSKLNVQLSLLPKSEMGHVPVRLESIDVQPCSFIREPK